MSLRSCALVVALVLAFAYGTRPLLAQNPPVPLCVEGCLDTVPPEIDLLLPAGDVSVQFPLIKILFCDDSSLSAASRWIKVNGVTQTSSFDYVTGGPVDCLNRKTSSTTSVPVNLGANSVEAHICDNRGNCNTETFTINRVTPGRSAIALKNLNADNQDRGLCLTTGGGEATAVQCGDLLVAHAMPGYQTMGRDRSLTLVYNSASAAPRPTVAAWVTLPTGVAAPDSVYAELQISGIKRASAWYTSWGGTNRVRQVVLAAPFDTVSGIHPFTLIVRNQYSTGPLDTTQTGSLLVVNRKTSEFGAGWWLAGVEQLVTGQSGNKILWIAGDGSAAVYDSIGPGVWQRALGGFRDSLVRFDSSGTWYRRTLRHRVKVTFSSTGKHVRTTNRLQHATTFVWAGPAFDTLKTITVPPANQSATTYTVAYVAGTKILDKITDPAGRVLDATITGGNLVGLTDPDGVGVSFGYDGTRRVTGRTNRRGYTTNYVYANALRVTRVEVPLSSQADLGMTNITHWDERGLAVGNVSGRLTPADTSLVYTQVDGPRTDVADVAKFWVDRWGAPVKLRDPLGYETLLSRSDATNPALVTRAQFADGRILGAEYNGRGNLTLVADSTYEGTGTPQTVVTSYVYGNTAVPDAPTETRTPVDTTRFRYDTTLGLPDTAVAPGGHRTRFEYYTTTGKRGLLYRVTELSVPVVDTTTWTKAVVPSLATELLYDVWGNDSAVTSPKGAQTRYERDGYRRVFKILDPMNHQTTYAYDSLNRPVAVSVLDTVALTTTYRYTPVGLVDSVTDPRGVARRWAYDAADRMKVMTDDRSFKDSTFYGRSGLIDSVRTRTGHMIRHRYDAAGQLVATVYPAYGIAGDSIKRTYDAVGRMLSAATSRDTLTWTYNREGSIRTERQFQRDRNNNTTVADVTQRYWYDAGGRRITFFTGTDTLRYSYGADGLLSRLAVTWTTGQTPDTFRFYWDGLGRRDSLVYSNDTHVHYGYDRDGHLRMLCSQHPPNFDPGDYLTHNVLYKRLDADGKPLEIARYAGGTGVGCGTGGAGSIATISIIAYDARHQVASDDYEYIYDRSGNRLSRHLNAGDHHLVDSLTYTGNLISQVFDFGTWKSFGYDANGSLTGDDRRVYQYNSLGQLTSLGSSPCRYDAMGRRVLRCPGVGGQFPPEIWAGYDGENLIRFKDAAATQPVWRFIHGPGLDDPLVALKRDIGTQNYAKYYYLSDGQGREYAFTDAQGYDFTQDVAYWQNGGNQSGAVAKATGFDNQRATSGTAADVSYYRNRYYDQKTGRWTQEDPIGIAGGTNLYQFSGNNPAMFADPFGLRPLTEGERMMLGDMCVVLDCDKVEIFEGNDDEEANSLRRFWLKLSGGRSITVGNNIIVADRDRDVHNVVQGEVLAHEMTHIGQLQSWGSLAYGFIGLVTQAYNSLGRDNPAYLVELPPLTKVWNQYGMEQQAVIVERCYSGLQSYCKGSPYSFPRR